jgi:hypothetical protein
MSDFKVDAVDCFEHCPIEIAKACANKFFLLLLMQRMVMNWLLDFDVTSVSGSSKTP